MTPPTDRKGYTQHTIVGPADHIQTLLRSAIRAGTLVYATAPRQVNATDQRVVIRLRARPPTAGAAPGRPPTRRGRRRFAHIAVASAGGLLVAGLAFAAGYTTRHLTVTALSSAATTFAGMRLIALVLTTALRRDR